MSSPFTLRSALARRVGLAGAVAFTVQSVAGCYTRQPADAGAVPPGATVVPGATAPASTGCRA